MQKKIIALALAAAAGSAFAQTNVTIYGIADVGQAYVKSSNVNNLSGQSAVGRLDSNSSYIGFKGTEDLGNGLKALFQFETSFAGDAGNWNSTATTGRDTFVGLTGGFGTVVAGNLTHPLRSMGAKVELMPAAAGIGTMASVTGTVAGVQTSADNRAQNAIAYVSPSFGGFTGTVAYVNGENKTNATQNVASVNVKAWQVAAQYDNGPIYAAIGYHRANDTGAGATFNQGTGAVTGVTIGAVGNTDTSILRLAGAYTLPTATKLTAMFDQTRSDISVALINPAAAAATGTIKRNAFSLGVAQSFGKNTVGLEYAKAYDAKVGGNKLDNTDSHILSAVYTYELSKRTMLHARYSKLTNSDYSLNNFYNNPVANPVALNAGSDVTGYMVGLRHAF